MRESYLERLIQLQRPWDYTPPLCQSPAVLQVTGHGCPLPLPPRPAAREEEWSCSLRDHHPSGPPPRALGRAAHSQPRAGQGQQRGPRSASRPSPKATLSTMAPGLDTSLTLSLVEPGGIFSNRLSYPENEREVLPGNTHLHTYVYSTGSMQTA